MTPENSNIVSAARSYLAAGLCVLPAHLKEKRAALPSWKEYQQRLPTEEEIRRWFGRDPLPVRCTQTGGALCIIAGEVSGHLEMLDFDVAGELYPPWAELVEERRPGLLQRLVRERSQGGGRHVCYRTEATVPGSTKLAVREVECPDGELVTIAGKEYVPRRKNGRWAALVTLIETKGEGGLFLCVPSPGYVLEQGSFDVLPVLTAEERDVLIECARALSEVPEEADPVRQRSASTTEDGRPGDDFNRRGDIRPVLKAHGWTLVRTGENEYWRRPGKDHGWSATLRDGVFYCFSTNASRFEAETAYSPFSVYALLEHGGDFAKAASALWRQGYGAEEDDEKIVDLSRIVPATDRDKEAEHPDPGPIPDELLCVPGFVNRLMEDTLATSPYPNRVLAFSGALVLQGHLAGRRVRDSMNTRTNLYILALGSAGIGKERPRKANQETLLRGGAGQELADAFASGEGIEDALDLHPRLLLQTDEFDKWLAGLRDNNQGRYQKIMETLLKMFSSADGLWPVRLKANQTERRFINQPSLSIFGTAVPVFFYEALSPDLLNNGFFARMLVVEAGKRGKGCQPAHKAVPDDLVQIARAWQEKSSAGDLSEVHPTPPIVPETPDARELLLAIQRECDSERAHAEEGDDEGAMALWARACEKTRRLALVYACSEDHENPEITTTGVEWAWAFVRHQTRRMLFMVAEHVADGEFDALCLKALRKVRGEPGGEIAHSVLLKRMKLDADHFRKLIETLQERGDLLATQRETGGRPAIWYRLRG